MELEVVVGTYDSSIIGCSVDILQGAGEQVLRKKYHEKDHVGCVRCVASGGHYLASGGTDETVKLYNMRKHLDVGTLLQHEGSITCLCFYKNSLLLSASEDGTVCVWKCGGNWDCLRTLSGHKYSVTCVAVHPSGKLALSVGKDRTVKTWDLSSGRAVFNLRLPKAADLVAWSPVGDHYVLTMGGSVTAYSVESGEATATFQVGESINSIQFVQDMVLAVGGDQPAIALHSITSGQLVASLEGHTSRVKGLALSPDNRLLFSASSDGVIRAWSLPETLEECQCVSSVETGSRLTCITALLPEISTKGTAREGKKRKRTLEEVCREADSGVVSGEEGKIRDGKESRKITLEVSREADNADSEVACKVRDRKKRTKADNAGGLSNSGAVFEEEGKVRDGKRKKRMLSREADGIPEVVSEKHSKVKGGKKRKRTLDNADRSVKKEKKGRKDH